MHSKHHPVSYPWCRTPSHGVDTDALVLSTFLKISKSREIAQLGNRLSLELEFGAARFCP
jgi:hypothetical protein